MTNFVFGLINLCIAVVGFVNMNLWLIFGNGSLAALFLGSVVIRELNEIDSDES